MSWTHRLCLVVVGLLVAWPPAVSAGHEPGGPDEVTAEEDHPEGCETATAEDDDGCGAQGRDHFANADHRPPVEACADRTTEAGGRITRIRPDGPRRDDGSLAFQPGACVYLPPGYQTSGLRYPVLYLLHGGGGDQADWVTFGHAEEILDRAYTADPSRALVAVMPDGRSGQWYDYEDGSFLVETYVLDHLVPYVDTHFRTIADRSGRVIAGLSNGGYGSVHFAAKRPDLFLASGGMSSNIGARTLAGLGESGAVHYQGSVPYQLASNLDHVDVILDLGTSCAGDVTVDLCATIAVDLLFWPDHIAFDARMDEVGHRGEFDYRETEGSHAWRWWSQWLEERDLPFFHERLAPPQPVAEAMPVSPLPESFRYRSIASSFEVWDHHVTVEREVREFLDLHDVTASGFRIQGSGTAVVTTAPRYEPGAVFSVVGAGDRALRVTADEAGRLRVPVDLGPSHTSDQFTPEADVAEAAGGYWVIRDVQISPTGTTADPPPAAIPARTTHPLSAGSPGPRPRPAAAPSAPARADTPPAEVETIAASPATPLLTATERGPQLIPTLAFLLLLIGGPAAWWYRRQHSEVDMEISA